ncbi:hypothetical protein, partial [Escherichia coli]|uniref:hypothetical protein n=1 Tax=Escherichia coli TaxID=562 RepID=UPI003A981262
IDSNDRYLFYRSFYSINDKAVTQEKQEEYEGFVSCFQLVNVMLSGISLADCSEENPVPYSAGNRDHRVMRITVKEIGE